MGYEVIVLSRGGGENLNIFNRPSIAEKACELKSLFVTAIGHKDDVTLLQKVADKAFITPSELGHFLNDIYNHTIEEVQNSKAKLVESVTAQLKANYQKQIDNLNEKIKAIEELKTKTTSEIQRVNEEQVSALKGQIEIIKKSYDEQQLKLQHLQSEKLSVLNEQIKLLTEQNKSKDTLINSFRSKISNLESQSSFNWAAVIVGIIIGLIIGIAMMRR